LIHQTEVIYCAAVIGAPPATTSPPDFLQLAGHPLRWRLLTELARSDQTVRDLCGRLGEAQNLVSYHLAKLREHGVVFARRSTADGRDSYYAVDLTRFGELLWDAAGALHPGLRPAPSSLGSVGRAGAADADPVRVLFLCTGNSARSQIAEALLRHRSDGAVEAFSAGSHPKPVHPVAVRVMAQEYGIDLTGQRSKSLEVYDAERFDWVISLCDRVREVCPELPGDPETVHWSIPDPSSGPVDGRAGHRAFRNLAAELDVRVGFLLAAIAEGAHPPSTTTTATTSTSTRRNR
jgi:protein-tyrosine-phosphatase/DNA-binding transcriptional ArsR family regulator